MVFSHEELFNNAGLKHGTGAICCGCPDCHCLNCYFEKYHERRNEKENIH